MAGTLELSAKWLLSVCYIHRHFDRIDFLRWAGVGASPNQARIGFFFRFTEHRDHEEHRDRDPAQRIDDERLHRPERRNVIAPLHEESEIECVEIYDQQTDLDSVQQQKRHQTRDQEEHLPDWNQLVEHAELKQTINVKHLALLR